MALKVTYDLHLTLMASSPYRLLGNRIGHGYATAKSRHRFRDFVAATPTVTLSKREVLVRLPKRADNPLLVAADFGRTDVPVPWLGRQRLQVVLG